MQRAAAEEAGRKASIEANEETKEANEKILNRKLLGLIVAEQGEGAPLILKKHNLPDTGLEEAVKRNVISDLRRGRGEDKDIENPDRELQDAVEKGYVYMLRNGFQIDVPSNGERIYVPISEEFRKSKEVKEAAIEGCITAYGEGRFEDSEEFLYFQYIDEEDLEKPEARKKIVEVFVESVLERYEWFAEMMRERFDITNEEIASEDAKEMIFKEVFRTMASDPSRVAAIRIAAENHLGMTFNRESEGKKPGLTKIEKKWTRELLLEIIKTGELDEAKFLEGVTDVKIKKLPADELAKAAWIGHIRAREKGWANMAEKFENEYGADIDIEKTPEGKQQIAKDYITLALEGQLIQIRTFRDEVIGSDEDFVKELDKEIGRRISFQDAPAQTIDEVKRAMKEVRNIHNALGYPKEYLYSSGPAVLEALALAAQNDGEALDEETVYLLQEEFGVTASEAKAHLGKLAGQWEAFAK